MMKRDGIRIAKGLASQRTPYATLLTRKNIFFHIFWQIGLFPLSLQCRRFDAIEEVLMEAGIVVELGVESGSELVALACDNDVAINGGKCLAIVGGDRLDVRGTDEGHGYLLTNASDGACGVKTAQLTTVGVALHVDVHRAQMQGRQEYQASAGAKDGKSVDDGLTDRLEET